MLPPGVTLGQYLKFTSAAFFSMFLGSHTVHTYYKPLKDLDKYIEVELEKLPEDLKQKVKVELH
jgi:Domain of unknown function (DUF4516)